MINRATPNIYGLITESGKVSPLMTDVLSYGLKYIKKFIQSSVWKQTNDKLFEDKFDAIVIYRTVYYRPRVLKHDLLYWLELIAHEEWHRQEVGNGLIPAVGWYVGYGLEYLRVKRQYYSIQHEIRAFAKGFGNAGKPSEMRLLLQKNDWQVYHLLADLNLPESEKRSRLKAMLHA